ncbi:MULTISPECIES: sensor histidine kinase [unclassified Duganella]|uniref:sensor histidine kinase n=1 Tax=unclassified Duganella TaxID=2636909 RepID=UPI001587029D|nr:MULTISPECIES: sensor histidine kinase [unclassified Duganella]
MAPAFAAPATIDMHHTSWTAREGAPQMVLAMAQTRDGWLWLGSNNGLFRFDGVRFERYAAPGHKLAAAGIATLKAFDDGALWIGYRYGGVSVLAGETLRHYGEADGLPASSAVWGLERDGGGRMWAATGTGLFYLDGQRWHAAGADDSVPQTTYKTLIHDAAGNLWAQGNDGVYQLPAGAQRFVKITRDSGNGVVSQVPDGSIWSWDAPHGRLLRLTAPAGGAVPANWSVQGDVASLMFDRRGDIWVGRMTGVEHHTRQGIQQSGPAQGLSGRWVAAIFEDREGSIWTSTATGIDRFRHKRVAAVPLAVETDVNPLAADAGGGVWVGRFHYAQSRNGAFDVRPAWSGTATDWGTDPATLYRDPAGALWLANYGELWRKDGTQLRRYAMPGKDDIIASMASDATGALWAVAIPQGLYRLAANGAWQNMESATGLPGETPRVLTSSAQLGLWLGYSRNRVAQLHDGRWRHYGPADGLTVGMVESMHLRGAHVWIGGENGVALRHDGRFIPVVGIDGASFDGVSGMVELDNGDLWLNAANGVFHIPAAEISRLVSTSAYRLRYERLDSLDGLVGNAPVRMPVPSMIQASDGQLWLATTTGVFRLDPSQQHKLGPAAPIQIRAIGQPGQLAPAIPGLRLPEGSSSLQIDYTALALAMPERVAFRYRLDGIDTQWQLAGPRRSAYYNNLGPGTYQFSVQATNYNGEWSGQPATLTFSIAPTITQSWWFKALCALLLLAACWALYRRRLRNVAAQVTARLQERTRERERIARELHDTVLQSVQGMILHVHAAVLDLPSREPARVKIEQALQQADDALLEGRDRVRDLRAGETEDQDLAAALHNAGARLHMPGAAQLQVQLEGEARKLHPLIYDEVLAIATEAITNACRHARASNIVVRLQYEARELRLTIRDDGVGIPTEVMAAGGRSNHWGICGMLERAERIHARLKLHSDAGAGTEWRLTLAYQYAVCV